MDCTNARERMLVAEPAELDAAGAGELAAHIRTCRSCAGAAATVLTGTRALAEGLEGARREDVDAASAIPIRRRPRYGRLALAAAASLALMLLHGPSARDTVRPAGGVSETTASAPAISVPAGTNAVVFRTRDPLITVVWYF